MPRRYCSDSSVEDNSSEECYYKKKCSHCSRCIKITNNCERRVKRERCNCDKCFNKETETTRKEGKVILITIR